MADDKLISSVSELGKSFSDVTVAMHEAIARNAGLTGTDHKYLGLLIDAGPTTAGELSKMSGLTSGAVTGLIDRLENKGLVKREYVKNDRRKVIIVPDLERASKILGPSFQILRERIVDLVLSLTNEEKKVVEKYLRDVIKIMTEVTSQLTGNEG